MTDHHRAPDQRSAPAPTQKQQRYLRDLAMKRGVSFTPPKTRAEASRLIDELRRRRPDSGADRARELKAVRADMMDQRGGSARVREHELDGYGSTAAWKGGRS